MKIPSIEERMLNKLDHIGISINGLAHTLEALYDRWKFPIGTMAEHIAPKLKEQREENRYEKQLALLEKQNKILIRTVIVTLIGVSISAMVGLFDIVIRLGFMNI